METETKKAFSRTSIGDLLVAPRRDFFVSHGVGAMMGRLSLTEEQAEQLLGGAAEDLAGLLQDQGGTFEGIYHIYCWLSDDTVTISILGKRGHNSVVVSGDYLYREGRLEEFFIGSSTFGPPWRMNSDL